MTTTPYGAWTSPLSAADVAAGTVTLSWPRLVGDEVWWVEGRPVEDGRNVVVRRGADGSVHDVLPAPWNARTRVHEYGGRPWVAASGALVFSEVTDQRLGRLGPRGEPARPPRRPAVFVDAGARVPRSRQHVVHGAVGGPAYDDVAAVLDRTPFDPPHLVAD
ncbi:MAG: S9 family peptidase, partial [Frankiales bacterium]|nr:S9 family peptidase [Frankiales bacterium]